MAKKLFLLDAYALIYRAYYAFIRAPRINGKGMDTSAIFGFCNSLFEVVSKESPSHIAVVFDPKGKTFRHESFPDYKAHREKTPENIAAAIPFIQNILKSLNIKTLCLDRYEADDVIGTVAKQAKGLGFEVYMMTPDKDYAQLVEEGIYMYKPGRSGKKAEVLDVEAVKTWFNVDSPMQVIDILGLMGDSSDNIPGCPGVGEKTATKLIQQYQSIDNLIRNSHQLKGKLKENIEKFSDQIQLSKELATINTESPIEWKIEDLILEAPNTEMLIPIFQELEFNSLTQRALSLGGHLKTSEAQVESASTSQSKNIHNTEHSYVLVDTEKSIEELINKLSQCKSFAFDTETTGLNSMLADIVGLSFAMEAHKAYYLPMPPSYDEAQAALSRFKPLLEDPTKEKIGQNIKFDMLILSRYGVQVAGPLFDTMIAHHLMFPESRHNMDFLAEKYLNYQTIKIEELLGPKGKSQLNMRDLTPSQVHEYASEDADITLQLKLKLAPLLEEQQLTDLFHQQEMPTTSVLAEMEQTGVILDTKALAQYEKQLDQRIANLRLSIIKQAGVEFNLDSPKQVGQVLFEVLKINANAKKTKTGQYSTSDETLQKLKKDFPIVEEILHYRGLKKLSSTYTTSLPLLVNPNTGRIHTSYNQAVVATGRLSSTNPNLQNIPIRNIEGKEIRRCFIPSNGNFFLSADYSQVELRIMAHLSGDKNFIQAFIDERDIHSATAAKIFGCKESDVSPLMRSKAKIANFGIIYGISAFGLAERLNISRNEAKALIDSYFKSFPQVKEYMSDIISQARKNGYVETLFGRRRYLPDINSRNAIVRGIAERNAINAPIQGTAADIIKQAMITISQNFKAKSLQSKMILQVHDELNFDVFPDELEQAQSIVREGMEGSTKISVPLTTTINFGVNWLEAH